MSPEKGYMFAIRPTRVSLVKRPANRRKFLVTKSEEELVMDEIIQIITKTEGENEETLIESLKSQDKDEGTIQAALSVYRTLSAFRDSMTPEDFSAIAKALEVKTVEELATEENIVKDVEAEEAEEKVADEDTETVEKTEEVVEPAEEVVEKSDANSEAEDSRIAELEAQVAVLKAQSREKELRDMVAGLQVGKSEDELYTVLKDADDKGSNVEALVESWKTASAVVISALTELGSDLPGDLNKSAGDTIDAEARRIAKDKNISVSRAYALVDPEFVRKYYED
jgi:hypothetical protein